MLLGFLLGFVQSLRADDIELHLHAAQIEVGFDQLLELFRALVALHGRRSESDIQLITVESSRCGSFAALLK